LIEHNKISDLICDQIRKKLSNIFEDICIRIRKTLMNKNIIWLSIDQAPTEQSSINQRCTKDMKKKMQLLHLNGGYDMSGTLF
jgi:hypothetical protein